MRVLIIEDEAPAARRLQKLITQVEKTAEIVGVVESVKQGINWFDNNEEPDLILSDIQLSDNLSFEIFNTKEVYAPIIFTTAFNQYAITAFEHLSIDYLLKPIRLENLQKALEKYKILKSGNRAFDAERLMNMLNKRDYRDRILVYRGENLISIPVNEVAYFYSEDGASFLKTKGSKQYILSDSLDKLEEELNPKDFFRANRQYLVSIDSVKSLTPYFNQKLKAFLTPETEGDVVISKLKATDFKNWMNS